MTKQSGNKSKDEDVFIPGQAYQMDLAFVSIPSKLEDTCPSLDKESVIVKQNSIGYIGFFTIINIASRQPLTHLFKNKDLPTQYSNQFFK